MVVLAIRDVKSECFKAPHFSIAVGSAIREFGDACSNPDSFISKHKEDYQLYQVGTFDEVQGVLVPFNVPVLLCSATDFK